MTEEADAKDTSREGMETPPEYASREDMPELLKKLQERKEKQKERNIFYRVGSVIVGIVLILAGIVLSGPGVPGPGFVVILLGLGLLALEFEPAERLLEKVIIWSDKLGDRVKRASTREKVIAGVIAAVAIGAFVYWAVFYDIPLIPVL